MSGPLGDPAVASAQRHEQHRQGELRAAYLETVMRSTEGRALFYELVFLLCALESPSYSSNGSTMAFQEGRRSIGIHLRDRLQDVCPDLWIRMLQERIVEAQATKERVERAVTQHKENDR